jgi:hypothetical protein
VIEQMLISLDEPKLGMLAPTHDRVMSQVYASEVPVLANPCGMVDVEHLGELRLRRGARFEFGRVGFANSGESHTEEAAYHGYDPRYDLNGNGVIDEADQAIVARNMGRAVRYNLYRSAYFGGNWISTGTLLAPEHIPGIKVIADYEYGGGYDSVSGTIKLLRTPGPNQSVWVEYFHDAPAEPGENNICIHLYREQ